jgi:hypothetical protein
VRDIDLGSTGTELRHRAAGRQQYTQQAGEQEEHEKTVYWGPTWLMAAME